MKCEICGKAIPIIEGYFIEADIIYCEECYAEKRYREVDKSVKEIWRNELVRIAEMISEIEDEELRKYEFKRWQKKVPKAFKKIFTPR